MYFVIYKSNNDHDIKIVDNAQDLDKAIHLMENHALDIIKQEDGLKKVETAFIKDPENQLTNLSNGHYLTKHNYDILTPSIKVWNKEIELSQGYFSTAAVDKVTLMGYFELLSYKPKDNITTNICPDCNRRFSEKNNSRKQDNEVYNNLLSDLKQNSFFLKMQKLNEPELIEEDYDKTYEESISIFIDNEDNDILLPTFSTMSNDNEEGKCLTRSSSLPQIF